MRHWLPLLILILASLFALFFASHLGLVIGAENADDANADPALAASTVAGAPRRTTDTAAVTTTFINLCSQHPAKCPVNESTWPGEPDAWQRTGKKSQWHSGTPSGITVIWEWSAPYSSSNPAHAGHRENHYEDYSNTPDAYPVVTGTAPTIFEWERWGPADDNYLWYQYAGLSESSAHYVGESDCESGVHYPVVDHDLRYIYTPMSVRREGQCVSGGYLAGYRSELWGTPMSPKRIRMCDDETTGVPASQSPRGNAICKLSPHVGTVYQRYVWGAGPTPADGAKVGCEAVVYVWGWPEPQHPSSGQDYQTWFRNGELRYSRWINLSGQISDGLPAPDDHAWWNTRCGSAWTSVTNWLYTGVYKIGYTVYTDTIALPPTAVATIPVSGGSLTSTLNHALYTFPAHTFTDTVIVTQTIRFQSEVTATGRLVGVNRFFDLAAVYSGTGRPAHPTQPYTITIQYSEADLGPAIEDTLALYSRDGSQWTRDPSSTVLTGTVVLITGTNVVYTDINTVVATPDHLSLWAVLGETRPVFLPLVLR